MYPTAVRENGTPVGPLDATIRVETSQKIECHVIVHIVEDSHDHESVADVVVDVREISPVPVDFYGGRRGYLHHLERPSAGVGAGAK